MLVQLSYILANWVHNFIFLVCFSFIFPDQWRRFCGQTEKFLCQMKANDDNESKRVKTESCRLRLHSLVTLHEKSWLLLASERLSKFVKGFCTARIWNHTMNLNQVWNNTSASIVPDSESHQGVSKSVLIPLSVTWAVLGLLSTILNLLVCFIVMIEKRLWTITNAFVVSLSVADLLVAAALIPIYLYENFSHTTTPISGYVIAFLLLASIFNIGAVTFERYIALTRPIGYRLIMSASKVSLIICISWIVPFGMSILPVAWGADPTTDYHKVYMIVSLFGFVLLPLLAMICIYARLLRVVRRFISRNRKRATWGNRTGERAGNEEKAVVVFALIFGMFLLSWMPLIFINLCDVINKPELVTNPIAYTSFYTMLFNTITDPLIYAFFKKDFSDCLRRRWRKKRHSDGSIRSKLYTQVEISLEQTQAKTGPLL